MHSFGLTERWLVLAEFPLRGQPARSRSAAAPTSRTTAGSRSSARGSRSIDRATGEATGPFETDAVLRLPPRQRLRGGRRGRGRHLHLRRRRRSSRTSTSTGCARASRSPSRSCGASGSTLGTATVAHEQPRSTRPRAAADQLRPLQRAPLPLRLGRRRGRPAGSTGSSRPTSPSGRTIDWSRGRAAIPGEPVFVAAPDAEAEDDGVLLSVVFDSRRAARSCSCSTPRTLRSWRGPRPRTTSRSASTGSSWARMLRRSDPFSS